MRIDDDIKYLNLECIAYKVCRNEGWSLKRVDHVEREYRAYLQLVRHFRKPGELAPTREVDTFWHYHILDTRKYATDCQLLFGAFLHHYPYSGVFSEEDATTQAARGRSTLALMQRVLSEESPNESRIHPTSPNG